MFSLRVVLTLPYVFPLVPWVPRRAFVVGTSPLQARKMPPSMHKFLYNLALAEGMVETDGTA
jgi:hypothetical protein